MEAQLSARQSCSGKVHLTPTSKQAHKDFDIMILSLLKWSMLHMYDGNVHINHLFNGSKYSCPFRPNSRHLVL